MEPATIITSVKSLIETFVAIKDKLMSHKSKNMKRFEEVIDPIYKAAQPVVDDYFMFFRRAIDELESAKTIDDLDSVIKHLRSDREKMLTSRALVRAMTDELGKLTHDKRCTRFFNRLSNIFEPVSGDNRPIRAGMSRSADEIHKMLEYRSIRANFDEEVGKDVVCESLRRSIGDIERNWVSATQIYVQLRFDDLSRATLAKSVVRRLSERQNPSSD